MKTFASALLVAATLAACGGAPDFAADEAVQGQDITGVGNVQGSGQWGAATTCKALPTGLPQLRSPMAVISLDGLTLHLWDRAGTFDKVYPIGPGAIENGVSLTPIGHFTTGPADTGAGAVDDGAVVGRSPWAWWYRCKMWWTDPDTHKVMPVYGGLPLIRLNGPPTLGYALHGPIDNFGAADGGTLRRGYVSHGCIRLRAQDIAEIYVLLHGHGNVPIQIQREVERTAEGRAVDLAQRFVGSECDSAADCNFAGGTCHRNPYGHSFCTAACTGSCADRPGEIATACVADPQGGGMCVRQATALNNFCRLASDLRYAPGMQRFGSARTVDACVPGSGGFVGDPCLSASDCTQGRTCELHGARGVCTQPCSAAAACPSVSGIGSVCVASRCLRACDVQDACGVEVAATCAKAGPALACLPL